MIGFNTQIILAISALRHARHTFLKAAMNYPG
jgi:hypothetical protein